MKLIAREFKMRAATIRDESEDLKTDPEESSLRNLFGSLSRVLSMKNEKLTE